MARTKEKAVSEDSYNVGAPRRKITFPGRFGPIAVSSPGFGLGNYESVREAILASGFSLPREENAYLLHAIYFGPEGFRESEEVRRMAQLLGHNDLLTFAKLRQVPEGLYVVREGTGDSELENMNLAALEMEIACGAETDCGVIQNVSGTVKFAPRSSYDYATFPDHRDLEKQGNLVAIYGADGVRKLSEVAKVTRGFRNDFYSPLDVTQVKSPTLGIWGEGDSKLQFSETCGSDILLAKIAFGVQGSR